MVHKYFRILNLLGSQRCLFFFSRYVFFRLEMLLYTLPTHAFMRPNSVTHPTFHFKHKKTEITLKKKIRANNSNALLFSHAAFFIAAFGIL